MFGFGRHAYLQVIGVGVLPSLKVSDTTDEFDHLFPLERRMIKAFDLKLCTQLPDRLFALA